MFLIFFRTVFGLLGASLGLILLAPLLVVMIVFQGVALVTRILGRVLEPAFLPWDHIIEFAPRIGWKNKANLRCYAQSDELFFLTTDEEGWRATGTSLAEAKVVVFGDSHAFGHGSDDQDYFGNLDSSLQVKAIGADGYNMVQGLLWMQDLASELKDKLVVWFVFTGNDLLDNLEPAMGQYRTPFVREAKSGTGWEVVTEHVSAAPWPIVARRYRQINYDRLAKVFTPSFVSKRAFEACEFLLSEGAELCERAGAHLVIVSIPEPMLLREKQLEVLYAHGADPKKLDPGLAVRELDAICGRLGLRHVSGLEQFGAEHYKELDPHWNRAGHQRMANLLAALRRAQELRPRENGRPCVDGLKEVVVAGSTPSS